MDVCGVRKDVCDVRREVSDVEKKCVVCRVGV
jgi:hypothetical protein